MADPILLDLTIGGIVAGTLVALGLLKKYWPTILSIFGPSEQKNIEFILKETYQQKINELEKDQNICMEDRKLLNDSIRILRTAGELMHQTIKSHEDSLRDGKKRFDKTEERCQQRSLMIETKLHECAEKIAKIEGRLDND